jgi:hypothetical protein
VAFLVCHENNEGVAIPALRDRAASTATATTNTRTVGFMNVSCAKWVLASWTIAKVGKRSDAVQADRSV